MLVLQDCRAVNGCTYLSYPSGNPGDIYYVRVRGELTREEADLFTARINQNNQAELIFNWANPSIYEFDAMAQEIIESRQKGPSA